MRFIPPAGLPWVLLLSMAAPLSAQQTASSTVSDRQSVTITVYNQDFGLVRENRRLVLPLGRVELEYGGVAAQIEAQTVQIRSGSSFRVLEQNYRYDLLSPQKLLEKYVGRTITLYRVENGEERAVQAELLSVDQGPIFRIGNEITYNVPARYAFPEIPENLIAKPTLVWMIDNQARQADVEVSYLTRGLNWKADYVLLLNEEDTGGDLTGWVTLTNQSGTSFDNARLQLVAGDVQRVDEFDRGQMRANMADAMLREAAFQEQSFFEYHLYTLERPTDVLQNEQKQVTLLEANGFDLRKRYELSGAEHFYRGAWGQATTDQKVAVRLEFENSAENQLGMALPGGIVRVYKQDAGGGRQFVGEDRIDHTPRNERLSIKMGDAFDVLGTRRQVQYRVISSCISESIWEVNVRNHKDTDVTVDVLEHAGGDWTILSTSLEVTNIDARTFKFALDVPQNGAQTVEYSIRVRWC